MNVSNKIRIRAAPSFVLIALSLGGCTTTDPYDKAFAQLRIGATRQEVTQAMRDPPNQRSRLDLPLVDAEQLVWKSSGGRHYVAVFALDHLVSKSVFD